jgi:hypothetical protein
MSNFIQTKVWTPFSRPLNLNFEEIGVFGVQIKNKDIITVKMGMHLLGKIFQVS